MGDALMAVMPEGYRAAIAAALTQAGAPPIPAASPPTKTTSKVSGAVTVPQVDPSAVALAQKQAAEKEAAALAAHKAALAQAEFAGAGYDKLATAGEGVPAQITGMFDEAAGKSEAFAQGFSQAFQSEMTKLQQQQQEQLRTQLGDPNATVRGNPMLGDAASVLGGALPASVYRTQGAGLSAAAALQPELIRSQGLQAVQTAKLAEGDAYKKLLADLADTSSKNLLSAQKTDTADAFKRESAALARERLGLARDAAVEKKVAAEEKRSGFQVEAMNPDGSFVYRKDEKGDPLMTAYEQGAAQRRALTSTANDLRRQGLQQSSLANAQRNSLYYLSMDKNGNISLYLDPKTGKPVLTKAGILRQDSLSVQDRIRSSEGFSRAMSLASAMSSQYGVVAFPTQDKAGNWVPQMQFTKAGKPVLTVSGRAAQAALTASLNKDKVEKAKVLGMAAAGAKAAATGYDEEKTLTPKYTVVEVDTNTGLPKTVPPDGNYSFPIRSSGGDVTGYANHHGPTSYEEAIRTAITSGIPVAVAAKALESAGIYPSISTEQAQQGLEGVRGLAPFPGSNPSAPPTGGRRTQSRGPVSGLIDTFSGKYGLDPAAVHAVALGEGGLSYGAVGDNGTSFGPFQLHVGGALPPGQDAAFANSPAGIEYALRKMAEAGARGLTGVEAIEAIIRKFERPLDPDASVRNAIARYEAWNNG